MTMAHPTKRLVLIGTALAIAAAICLVPTAAWAHVGAAAAPAANSATAVTFTFTHGCETAPTTSLRVQLPAGASGVAPENPPGWTSTATETEVSWTGGSIPNGQRGSFRVVMTIPGQAGETVYLPTIQGCPGGVEEAWIDKSPDPEATNAAPRIVLTSTVTSTTAITTTVPPASYTTVAPSTAPTTAAPSTAPTTTGPSAVGTTAPSATGSPAATSTSSSTPLIIGAVLAVLVLLGVGGYLLSRRSGADPS
jgi:uncharacterized protein YcnI